MYYYVLHCLSPDDAEHAMLSYIEDDEDRSWHAGKRFDRPPAEPIQVEIDPDLPGVIPEFTDQPLPLMTTRLHEALRRAGVANLDVYKAVITDPNSGRTFSSHVAANIIGVVAAADLRKSNYDPSIPWFDSLSINTTATRGALLFRLAESVNAILIHERVKESLDKQGINTLTYIPPEQWAG